MILYKDEEEFYKPKDIIIYKKIHQNEVNIFLY